MVPSQFQKKSASPGDKAAGRSVSAPPKEDSAPEALGILEREATTPQEHAAIKTLRVAMSDGKQSKGSSGPMTPGQRAANK